jgi:hypothetical protein
VYPPPQRRAGRDLRPRLRLESERHGISPPRRCQPGPRPLILTSRNPGEPVNNRPFTLLLGSTSCGNRPVREPAFARLRRASARQASHRTRRLSRRSGVSREGGPPPHWLFCHTLSSHASREVRPGRTAARVAPGSPLVRGA